MKSIQFNEDNIIKEFSSGMESTIYLYKNGSEIVVLKVFKKELKFSDKLEIVSEKVFENKRKKLEIISESEIFKDEVPILDLVYDNGEFIGYTMPILKQKKFDTFSRKKEKIFILKELRKKVEKFNSNGIYLGDFNANNIFYNKNGITLVDLDNIRIGELDFDLLNTFQRLYFEKSDTIEDIDTYSFNLFTVTVFERIINTYVWSNLNESGLPRILDTKENRRLIEDMRNIPKTNLEKRYLIDNIKKF